MEKKQKQIDKQITEWKSRCEQKEAEYDQAAREARQYNTEVCVCVCVCVHDYEFQSSFFVCM